MTLPDLGLSCVRRVGENGERDVSPRIGFVVLLLTLTMACAGPRSGSTWYEARCIDQYNMRPGTAEFAACASRERQFVEETQARGDRFRP
jgi:hypothetical protein